METQGLDQLGNAVGKPQQGDTVGIHVKGYYFDAKTNKKKEYEDSRHREKLTEFKIGTSQVIPGLETSVLDMELGDEATITMTPDVGYGDQEFHGYSAKVPPNSNLEMHVALMKIVRNGKVYLRKRPKDKASCMLKCLYNLFRGH